jgi:uncharacterized protein (UPF0335 family)
MDEKLMVRKIEKLEEEVRILRGCINDMQTLYKQAGEDIGYAFKEIQRLKTGAV